MHESAHPFTARLTLGIPVNYSPDSLTACINPDGQGMGPPIGDYCRVTRQGWRGCGRIRDASQPNRGHPGWCAKIRQGPVREFLGKGALGINLHRSGGTYQGCNNLQPGMRIGGGDVNPIKADWRVNQHHPFNVSMAILGGDADLEGRFVFTVTDGGFAKRTVVGEYRQQGRGGLGIKAMRLTDDRGSLVGGLIVGEGDEVISIKTSGQVARSAVADVPVKGRDTMGVKFVSVRGEDSVAAIALYPEDDSSDEVADPAAEAGTVAGTANDEAASAKEVTGDE